jgi:cyclophilin family peptidyl-prolyl cis-trans isomerase
MIMVIIKTNMGDIKLALDTEKAPATVKNFLNYVDEGFYDGTIFHRVIDGFMIQGGGFTGDMRQKPTRSPVRNEAGNRLSNVRGTIAMARTMVVDSATSQFFINLADNLFLDYRGPSPQEFGYCVFGHVTEGMDVVDRIKGVLTTTRNGHQNVPVDPVEIISVRRATE